MLSRCTSIVLSNWASSKIKLSAFVCSVHPAIWSCCSGSQAYISERLSSRARSLICFYFAVASLLLEAFATTFSKDNDADNAAIKLFREYLRIRTVACENPEYASVEAFLRRVTAQIQLEFQRRDQLTRDGISRPIFILTIRGRGAPTVRSLLLLGHFDVAPVSREHWTHELFGAELVGGLIYARGAQDMTFVTIAYLCALGRLLHTHRRTST